MRGLGVPYRLELVAVHFPGSPTLARSASFFRIESSQELAQRSGTSLIDSSGEFRNTLLDLAAFILFLAAPRLEIGKKTTSLGKVVERTPKGVGR